jgi:hypothetical protein
MITIASHAVDVLPCLRKAEPDVAVDILAHLKRLASYFIDNKIDLLAYGWHNFYQSVYNSTGTGSRSRQIWRTAASSARLLIESGWH